MNRKGFLIVLLGIMLAITQSCQKREMEHTGPMTTQTITATVSKNTTYSYTLPATHGSYTITTQAAHSSASSISTNAAGSVVFTYVAATDYVGTDNIVVAQAGDGHSHGNCNHGNSAAANKIVFNMSVTDVSTAK